MRRSLGAIQQRYPIGNANLSLKSFSSASGRGRGSPILSDPPSIAAANDNDAPVTIKPGIGRGRGSPFPFSGLGRGTPPSPETTPPGIITMDGETTVRNELHLGIVSALSRGAGRGNPPIFGQTQPVPPHLSYEQQQRGPPVSGEVKKVEVENRHIRPPPAAAAAPAVVAKQPKAPKLSREDAVKKAVEILSKGDRVGVGEGTTTATGERRVDDRRGGFRGRGRGRGGGFRGRGGRGTWGGRGRDSRDKEDDFGSGLYCGDDADGEKLAKRLGPDKMNTLVEAFEEMGERVLPSPVQDAYIDALHTNMMIECEPEWLMEEFGSNPDIDDTPPMSLRDAFEKMKPFLMAYENIQSHEEWEKIIEETMKTVPLMKEIVDHYSGPDRVTAKQQQKELRRVADTLPDNAHASVKRFTDRAILSLQSNPGWGFDKKCQFMDKLVLEAKQHYK